MLYYLCLDKETLGDGNAADRALQTLPHELFIQVSTARNTENGIFTQISLPRGSIMGPYDGDVIKDPNIISQVNPR